jgi:hypothetical protein
VAGGVVRALLLDVIREEVADLPAAPEGVELYSWVHAPASRTPYTVDSVDLPRVLMRAQPLSDYVNVTAHHIFPKHYGAHGGLLYSVGWDEDTRTAVVWTDDDAT